MANQLKVSQNVWLIVLRHATCWQEKRHKQEKYLTRYWKNMTNLKGKNYYLEKVYEKQIAKYWAIEML